jgi:hypothetical protein
VVGGGAGEGQGELRVIVVETRHGRGRRRVGRFRRNVMLSKEIAACDSKLPGAM